MTAVLFLPAAAAVHALLQVKVAGVPTTPWEMVSSASTVTKFVLLVLLLLSLASWAIMLAKWREFRSVAAASRAFVSEFEHAARVDDAATLAQSADPNPFSRVFGRVTHFLA